MATISSSGIGSGIDISGLVDSLISAERVPTERRYDNQEAVLQAKLSAYGSLKSALSSFQGSLSQLKFATTFNDVVSSTSDEDLVTASGTSIANPGNYALEITTLAQAQSLSSKSFSETSSPVGTGTLTFEFGDFDGNSFIGNSEKTNQIVTISSDDNSLQGIRDAVNQADIGVTASLVNDGSGFKLLFTSDETGKENGLKISVADTSDADNFDASGLSQLAFDPASVSNQLTENLTAEDAAFSLNGLNITSSSNTVSSAISGITFTLKGITTPGSPVNITIANNDSQITDSIVEFTTKFNELIDTISQLSDFDSSTEQAGPLLGDSAARGVESQLRRLITSQSTGPDGEVTSLSTIGITTDRNGKLSLDSNKLQAAITDNRDAVAQIFSAKGSTTDAQINVITSSANTQTGTYSINLENIASRGVLTGTASAALSDLANSPLTIDDTNNSFSLLIDGIGTGNIDLTQKIYNSGAELATEIQARINSSDSLKTNGSSVLVSFSGGKLQISSALFSAKSSVEITAIEGSNDLGLTLGKGTSGTDVRGTIGGQSAIGLGNLLTGRGDTEGVVLEITGGSVGNRGTLFFNRGIADQLDNLISQFLNADSLIDSRTSGLNTRIDRLNEQRSALDNRLENLESRLFRQFNNLDIIVARLQSTGNFLEQQLANLPGFVRQDR